MNKPILIMPREDKFHIQYELESNSIHAPDGEYLLKIEKNESS